MRFTALLLSSCLIAGHVGCVPAEKRAGEHEGLIAIGMTQAEVRDILGAGESWSANDGIDGEMWHYSYGSVPDPGQIALQTGMYLVLAATIFGLIILLSAGGGSVPDLDSAQGYDKTPEPSGRIHFFVYFDPTGRVRRVSGSNPCHD